MSETMQAYCVKCKTKRDIANAQATFTATGTPATSGECAVCGTKLFRMGETAAHANLTKPEIVPRKKEAKSKTAAKPAKGKSTKTSKSAGAAKPSKSKKAKKDSPS